MPRFFPFFGLGRKESLQTIVPVQKEFRFEREYYSPDKKRKFVVHQSSFTDDGLHPIQSVRFMVMGTEHAWDTVLRIDRGIDEDEHHYFFIAVSFPFNPDADSLAGTEAWYHEDGVLEFFEGYRWGPSRFNKTPEAVLLFRKDELPHRIDVQRTGKAFIEQLQGAMTSGEIKYFAKPILFSADMIGSDTTPRLR